MNTKLLAAVKILKPFVSEGQLIVMVEGTRGEEKDYFKNKIIEMASLILAMPKTYETDGQGMNAIAYLHYFLGGFDWYVTEKDKGDERDEVKGVQQQAFGLVKMHETELGYISIEEIRNNGGELDLHWTPKPLAQCA